MQSVKVLKARAWNHQPYAPRGRKRGPSMRDVVVVTDTSSSIDAATADSLGISLVPINIQFGSQTFRDGVDIDLDEFYRRLDGGELATTSQPSPGDFLSVYKRLAGTTRAIISVHVTGKASGTIQSARLAQESLPEVDIQIVDSGQTSMGLGFMAMEAARATLAGMRKDEILRIIEDARSRVNVFAALPTLKYLARSGRIGAGQALLASALSIKPILTMRDGLLEAVERVRTYPRALTRMADMAVEAASNGPVKVAVLHTRARQEAVVMLDRLRDRLNLSGEPMVMDMGVALASHGGPGMIGVATLRQT